MKTKRAAEDDTAKKRVKTAAIDPLPLKDATAVIERFDAVVNQNTLKDMGGRAPRIDGHLYVRDKVVVVYCSNHDMFYTREDIVTRRVLDYPHVKLKKSGKRAIDKSVIILERNDLGDYPSTAWEPEHHPIHPNFVFRIPSSKHADEMVYRKGGAVVNRRYGCPKDMPCYLRKYDEVMKKGPIPKCCESPGERGMAFDRRRPCRYSPQSNCSRCMKKKDAVRSLEKRKTVEGKATLLASDAVVRQNERYAKGLCDTQLNIKNHKRILVDVLTKLGDALIAKAHGKFPIEPHQITLDKIDDVEAFYIGWTTGDNPIFSNMAVTVKINNPPVKLTGQQMARMVELSREMKTGEPLDNSIDPQLLATLEDIRENLGKRGRGAYKTEFTTKLARGLSEMCHGAKTHQNDRGKKKNRDFDTMDNSHVVALKKKIIALFIAQKGRCAISGHPITFARRGACDESSPLALPASIDRNDNEIGYVEGNLELVCDTFQAEFKPSSGFKHLRWSREFFKTWGEVIYSGGLTVEYGELPQDVRDALEAKYRGCMA
jgi:hypothetical protein